MAEKVEINQDNLKKAAGLTFLTKRKLDPYSTMRWVIKDIFEQRKTKTDLRYIGWCNPKDLPIPGGLEFNAATSGSYYNIDLYKLGEKIIEYDFNQAYTNIMKNYSLPTNTYLKHIKHGEKKVADRFDAYNAHDFEYSNLSTFMILDVDLEGYACEWTYAETDSQGMLKDYGRELKLVNHRLTEIELKLLIDHYHITRFVVYETFLFKCKKGMLDEYFKRIEPISEYPELSKVYKRLRTSIFGYIGQRELKKGDEGFFDQPIYNRVYSAMVAGAFRDKMVRYEQKYVHSEYGLMYIVADGIYFKKEVPELEELVSEGVLKKNVKKISEKTMKDIHELKEIRKGLDRKFDESTKLIKGLELL